MSEALGRRFTFSFSNGWTVLAIALCVRGGVLLMGLASLQDDPDAYARLARNWARSGILGVESTTGSVVVPTAFRPPLYPWLLSWLADSNSNIPLTNIALLHLLLGCATVWLTWSIAQRMRIARPWLPALGVAVDPLLLRASQLVMTETLAACLAVLAWRLWLVLYPTEKIGAENNNAERQLDAPSGDNRRTGRVWLALVALGCVLGLSVLARPTAGPWVALIALGMLLFCSSKWQRCAMDCATVSLLVAVCLTPWIIRNALVFGKPIWATTHGGYTLLLANNPLLYEHFERNGPSRNWDAEPFHERWSWRYDTGLADAPSSAAYWLGRVAPTGHQRPMDELADDALAYAAARGTIARQPRMFGLSSIYRLGWLWAAWPNAGSTLSRIAIGIWYTSMFALAVAGMCRGIWARGCWLWLKEWWLPLSLVLSLSIVHAVYWSNMRMRGPAMAVVYMAASTAFYYSRHTSGPDKVDD